MRSLHNIEPSGFHRGKYVGYAAGKIWRITKINSAAGKWQARCLAPGDAKHESLLFASTLGQMSVELNKVQS